MRDNQVALPDELTNKQQQDLLRAIAAATAERYDTTVTWHHHEPGRQGDKRNRHGHILFATRMLADDGLSFGKKLRQLDDRKTGPEEVTAIREIVEALTNAALAAAGRIERISLHRDPDNEPELPPQPTIGPARTAIERRAAAERRGTPVVGESIAETVRDGAGTAAGRHLAAHTEAAAEYNDIIEIETVETVPKAIRAAGRGHVAAPPAQVPVPPPYALEDLQLEATERETVRFVPEAIRLEARSHVAAPPAQAPVPPPYALEDMQLEATERETVRFVPEATRLEARDHRTAPPDRVPVPPPYALDDMRTEATERETARRRDEREAEERATAAAAAKTAARTRQADAAEARRQFMQEAMLDPDVHEIGTKIGAAYPQMDWTAVSQELDRRYADPDYSDRYSEEIPVGDGQPLYVGRARPNLEQLTVDTARTSIMPARQPDRERSAVGKVATAITAAVDRWLKHVLKQILPDLFHPTPPHDVIDPPADQIREAPAAEPDRVRPAPPHDVIDPPADQIREAPAAEPAPIRDPRYDDDGSSAKNPTRAPDAKAGGVDDDEPPQQTQDRRRS